MKNDSTRDNSLTFFEAKLSSLKYLWWIPILLATCNIGKNRLVHRPLSFRLLRKISCSKHAVVVFNISKKDSISRLALSQNLKNGVWLRRFAEGVLFLWQLQDIFLNLFLWQICRLFLVNGGGSISKCSLIKRTCLWLNKLLVLWTLNRGVKIFLRTAYWIMNISWKHYTGGWGKNI